MRHDCLQWVRRIRAVEREHSAVRLAIDRLLVDAQRAPLLFKGELTLRDIRHAADRLDGTYMIRLFAEFETGLRLFWPTAKTTDPPSRTRDMVDGVAATWHIPYDQIRDAHAVREYRNTLVHEREAATASISISEARGHLCRFFSFLPRDW
jgi:hypothetical protein